MRVTTTGAFFVALHCAMASTTSFPLGSLKVECAAGACDAKDELTRHVERVCGRKPDGSGSLTIAIGTPPPGHGAAADFMSYGKRVGDTVYLWGDDTVRRDGAQSPGTLFAVYGFIEEVLGVRWVRPGDDGVIAKAMERVEIPENWKYEYRPVLDMCSIRAYGVKLDPDGGLTFNKYIPASMRLTKDAATKVVEDYRRWLLRMRLWDRNPPVFGHAFTNWNRRFRLDHPEYLALGENGERGWSGDPKSVHDRVVQLCVSNEAVVDQIIDDWVKRGKPRFLNICASDSKKFCLCDKCRALDCPLSPDEPFMVHKTDRYLNFCNRVAAKAVALRPDVMVSTYAYSSYKHPPRRERLAYPDNTYLGMVPSILDDSKAMIEGWKKAGMRHFSLRPNYLCYTGVLPRGYEREYFEILKMNLREGVSGMDFDNYIRGGVTDFETYAIARGMARPDLSFEKVEEEFLSQYGAAASAMGRYYAKARARGEKMLRDARSRETSEQHVLDDSHIKDIFILANTPDDLASDREILVAAAALDGLSAAERRRIDMRILMCDHMLRTREFLVARDTMSPEAFGKVALSLLEYRVEIAKRLYDDWGRMFKKWPCEVSWWRAPGAREAIRAKYPEVVLRN